MDLKEVMAINLRRLRHAKQMTQEELADSSGLSARYVGAIERADVSASVTVLGRIADALGVEAADLIRKTTPKAPTGVKSSSSSSDWTRLENLIAPKSSITATWRGPAG